MPLGEFRAEARRHLKDVFVSIKAKNKVVTRNVNITRGADGRSIVLCSLPHAVSCTTKLYTVVDADT